MTHKCSSTPAGRGRAGTCRRDDDAHAWGGSYHPGYAPRCAVRVARERPPRWWPSSGVPLHPTPRLGPGRATGKSQAGPSEFGPLRTKRAPTVNSRILQLISLVGFCLYSSPCLWNRVAVALGAQPRRWAAVRRCAVLCGAVAGGFGRDCACCTGRGATAGRPRWLPRAGGNRRHCSPHRRPAPPRPAVISSANRATALSITMIPHSTPWQRRPARATRSQPADDATPCPCASSVPPLSECVR